ncbi:MAG: hypothetical protein JXB88_25835 [Spirochaetales bacterium]|nr:hypothetical protein [Spirochaetales bacterium]
MKTYGMMIADNGTLMAVSGAPDEHWNDDDLSQLKQVKASDLEAADVSSLMVNPDSAQVND